MLNDLIKGVVKLAVLLALVKFVLLPMLPSNLSFGGGLPSPADALKFGKDMLAQFDPTKILREAPKPPEPPSVTVHAPDPAQAGRDADQMRIRTQHTLEQKGQEVLNSLPKPKIF